MAQTVSGKTPADLILDSRYLVNDADSDAGYFASDTEFLSWFNQARFAVCRDGHGIQETEDIDLATATVNYTPVNDYIDIVGVHYINTSSASKALLRGNINKIGHIYDVNEPTYWDEFDGQLWIYPALDARTTETIKAFQISMPNSTLALTDSIDTPAIFDLSITYFMAAQYYFKEEKYSSHAQMMAKFDEIMYANRLELNDAKK